MLGSFYNEIRNLDITRMDFTLKVYNFPGAGVENKEFFV
jgi:hypothetical protein